LTTRRGSRGTGARGWARQYRIFQRFPVLSLFYRESDGETGSLRTALTTTHSF